MDPAERSSSQDTSFVERDSSTAGSSGSLALERREIEQDRPVVAIDEAPANADARVLAVGEDPDDLEDGGVLAKRRDVPADRV
jgi:hypothetical protein